MHAVLNLEAHSTETLPSKGNNIPLISFHAESDIIATYAYTVMGSFGMCMNDPDGVKTSGQRCENMLSRNTPFFSWCARNFGGDRFTCIFNVVPHIARSATKNTTSRALAATWVSATCDRHNRYLEQLMKHMPIDSMGQCFRNRRERQHPALNAKDPDGIWWGRRGPPPRASRGVRKTLIAGHYKFYLSLENTILDDYVTEKFFEGFLTDSVMVYLGAPNAQRYAPAPHSFINALDFPDPRALAAFLTRLAADPVRYAAYGAWRRERPIRVAPGFANAMLDDVTALGNRSILCRLCGLASGTAAAGSGRGVAGPA